MSEARYVLRSSREYVEFEVPDSYNTEDPFIPRDVKGNPIKDLLENYTEFIRACTARIHEQIITELRSDEVNFHNMDSMKISLFEIDETAGYAYVRLYTLETQEELEKRVLREKLEEEARVKRQAAAKAKREAKIRKEREEDLKIIKKLAEKHNIPIVT